MKRVLMIGMGKFGRYLCDSMSKLGNELMVVDVREEVLEELVSKVMWALLICVSSALAVTSRTVWRSQAF